MAGWTYTSTATPIKSVSGGSVDGGLKATAFPAVGASTQEGWWQDFAYDVAIKFAAEAQKRSRSLPTNIVIGANNGTGDSQGIGTLTIVLTTS